MQRTKLKHIELEFSSWEAVQVRRRDSEQHLPVSSEQNHENSIRILRHLEVRGKGWLSLRPHYFSKNAGTLQQAKSLVTKLKMFLDYTS